MSEKRVFGVEYKVVFEGYVAPFEVEKKEGPTELGPQVEAYWEEIKRNIRKMDMNDWQLELSCERCGGLVYLDEGKVTFECECTTESPNTQR
tara:strand:+ start:74 stop:349 length:276 start_codon:yes stop_codon:yes gene_type:complete